MSKLARIVAIGLVALATGGHAAEGPPVGFWRATNDCFLSVFVLIENGQAQAAYQSGEQEPNGMWSWDGTTLKITSPMFPEDEFTGHLANDRVEADYVWHDLDRDQLNRQSCVFERVEPMRL